MGLCEFPHVQPPQARRATLRDLVVALEEALNEVAGRQAENCKGGSQTTGGGDSVLRNTESFHQSSPPPPYTVGDDGRRRWLA
jgi:hypothetical protein